MPFKPGTPKPQNSGSKKGQKYAKTVARENGHADFMAELARLSAKHTGMSVEEIMEDMNINVVTFGIMKMIDPNTAPGERVKYWEGLKKATVPDLKGIEVQGQTVNRIEIVLGDGSSPDMFNQAIEYSPAQVIDTTVQETINETIQETIHEDDEADDQD